VTSGDKPLEGGRLLLHPLTFAVVEVVNERGYELADVETISERAGISRAEFDRQFEGKADLVMRIVEAGLAYFRERVETAYAEGGEWPDNIRAAAYETARWLIEFPEAARFGMISATAAGEMVRALREEIFRWGASLVDAGRPLAGDPEGVPQRAGLLAIGAVVEELRRSQEGRLEGKIVAAVPRLMYAAVRPYLGEEAARRELEMPLPPDLEAHRQS
jgi:AcrR family transcriptional regulator